MAKKRAKPGKHKPKPHSKPKQHSKKKPSKAVSKTPSKSNHEEGSLKDALHQLEIMAEEKVTGHKIDEVEKEEKVIEKNEEEIIKEEMHLGKETKKVENLEKEIIKEVSPHPMKKFGIKDINKGIVGAFIGVVAHFGFIYGKAIADNLSTSRATLIIVFAYLMVVLLMYETGYRDIKKVRLLGIFPKRATIVFATSLIVIVIIFFLFNLIDTSDLLGLYKGVAVTSVLASLGAGTADLIGRD